MRFWGQQPVGAAVPFSVGPLAYSRFSMSSSGMKSPVFWSVAYAPKDTQGWELDLGNLLESPVFMIFEFLPLPRIQFPQL